MNNHQRISKVFFDSKAYVGYLTAGDGGIQKTLESALALIEGGINVLEIGVPFSDPIADGPIIQRAAARSLEEGTTLANILWLTAEIRKKSDVPLILFSYLNPVLNAIKSNFLHKARKAGIDGLLIIDCPMEESQKLHELCRALDLACIYVITDSTPLERIKLIAEKGCGFLYYACQKGTTGPRESLPEGFSKKIKLIKNQVNLPIVVGFGISNREMACEVLESADGVVIGSLFVKALEEGMAFSELTQLVKKMNPLAYYL